MLYEYGKRTSEILRSLYLKFSLLHFGGVSNKTIIPLACWIWEDYGQPRATRLVGYLTSFSITQLVH